MSLAWRLRLAENMRMKLARKQQKEIKELYERVAKKIAKEAEKLPDTSSAALRWQYLKTLQGQVSDQIRNIGSKLEGTLISNMAQVATAAAKDNLSLLQSIGMPMIKGAFSHVPDDVVSSIVTGQVYGGNWSLSRAIWNNTSKTQKDINTIIAEGVAQNKSVYDIAKDLEKYVSPSAKKPWDWNKVYPGTARKVDYNAQRLARTMVSHAYQQSFVQTTIKNPFVTQYRWLGSNSHRICPLCAERDGQLFDKDDLPLDHPNGMCTFEAVMTGSMADMANRIADWALGGSDPELDDYSQYLKNS